MNSEDRLTAIGRRARHISELELQLAQARSEQDRDVVAARQEGTPWGEIVDADGRSRQMLNRVFRTWTEEKPQR